MDNTEPGVVKFGVRCLAHQDKLYEDIALYRNIARKFTWLWYIYECSNARIDPISGRSEPRHQQMIGHLRGTIREEMEQLAEEKKDEIPYYERRVEELDKKLEAAKAKVEALETKRQTKKQQEKLKTAKEKLAEIQQESADEREILEKLPDLISKLKKGISNKECERNYVYQVMAPHWFSHMGESICSSKGELLKKWMAHHPKIKARRNFLAVNGEGNPILCKKISITLKNTLWQIAELSDGSWGVKFKIRRDLAEKEKDSVYELAFLGRKLKDGRRKLESDQIFKLKQLGAFGHKEHWKKGSLIITTDDKGHFRVIITYTRPVSSNARELDPNRVLEVNIDNKGNQEKFLTMKLISGKKANALDDQRNSSENAIPALAEMRRHDRSRDRLMAQYEGCSTNHKARNEIRARQEKRSRSRQRTQERWNGTWTKKIITVANNWKAGTIFLKTIPSGGDEDSWLFDCSWSWYDFKNKLKYKSSKAGITLKT